MITDDEVEETHDVGICYAGGPGEPYYKPCAVCSCGWSSGRQESFADAGYALDQHIEEVKR